MTKSRSGRIAFAALAAVAFGAVVANLAAPPAAQAQSAAAKALVDAAKARGEVGEQGDGFLGFVRGSGDAALAAAVAEINAGRAAVYRETAQRTGVTADAAGQATARQLESRLPAGQYFKPLGGDWSRK